MSVEDFIKKQENKNLLEQINKAFTDQPDSDELKVHSEMRKKQLNKHTDLSVERTLKCVQSQSP